MPAKPILILSCLALILIPITAQAQAGSFMLQVKNPTTVDMVNEPVATGISVPYGIPVTDPGSNFFIADAGGNPIPSQFKVLSRWLAPRSETTAWAKWVLVMFRASVPAQSTATYFVKAGAPVGGQVTVEEVSHEVRVNTGAAQFTLDKLAYTIFKDVRIGAQPVLAGPGELEFINIALQGINPVINETLVEEVGSVRTVVRQKGSLPTTGLNFTVRYFFWTGRTDVKVEFRLENNGSYGELPMTGVTTEHSYFESINLVLNLADVNADVVTTNATRDTNGASYALNQDWSTPSNALQMLSGFSFSETQSGATVGSGGQYAGSFAVNGSGGAISASVDRFWQNYPKAFESTAGSLRVGLFPSFGSGPQFTGQYGSLGGSNPDPLSVDYYRFEGSRWKTHTVRFDFRSQAGFAPAELVAQAECVNNPLMAMPDLSWNMNNFAFGVLVGERRANAPEISTQRFEKMCDILAHDSAADHQDSIGKIGLPGFLARGGTIGGVQAYGWHTYGDIPWGNGYCSNHYDMPFGVLINFFRTGDTAFFDMGRDLIAHRRDYDQNHSTDPSAIRRGAQSYEKGWFHGNYTSPAPSHTWVHGLLLYYVMTGDEGCREAALEVGDFIGRESPETWDGLWGARILGWQLDNLVHLWNYTGDISYLQQALQACLRWDTLDLANGGTGFVPNNGYASNPHAKVWMHTIVLSAIGKFYLATKDPLVLPIINRLANWLVNHGLSTAPGGPPSSFTVGKVWTLATMNWNDIPSTHHAWGMSDALAYAAVCLGKQSLYDLSEQLFEGVSRYHQISASDNSPRDLNDPTGFSLISMKMLGYPNSESKILSNIGLWGHAFPALRAAIQ